MKRFTPARRQGGNTVFMALLAAAALAAGPRAMGQNATPSETEKLREELKTLKQDYEERIRKLEERLRAIEPPAVTNLPPAPAQAPLAAAAATNAAVQARAFAKKEYERDTESRERALLYEERPFTGRLEHILQEFVDIHGYFRAGYGRDDKGGPQVGFQAPGAMAKYRLGNEAENYGELTFGKSFYVPGLFKLNPPPEETTPPPGPVARFQTTISVYNPYQDLLSASGTSFGLPEVWGSIGNVVASQPSMKFWAGSRYYRRHDININDFYFYNMSGTGGGVEDIELPFGKLAFAWIGAASSSGISSLPEPDANNKAGYSKANWDARLYDVPLPLGKGEFGFVYARADSGLDVAGNSAPNSEGVAFTFLHTHQGLFSEDGVNKFSVQYGTGAAKTFTSGFETFTLTNGVFIRPDERDSWRFRVTEHFTANLSDSFSIGPALVYQYTDYADGNGKVQWASLGVRPIWHFNKYFSLAAETGVDWVKDDAVNNSDYLYKVTLAPQVSLGGRFMSRPSIRAFVTYSHWGDDFVGSVGGNDYRGETEGLTYGIQTEVWW